MPCARLQESVWFREEGSGKRWGGGHVCEEVDLQGAEGGCAEEATEAEEAVYHDSVKTPVQPWYNGLREHTTDCRRCFWSPGRDGALHCAACSHKPVCHDRFRIPVDLWDWFLL